MSSSPATPLLFLPGPVTCAAPVLKAMSRPMIDHRGSEFAELLARVSAGMQPLFGTSNEVLVLGSSGTGALETAVANLFGSGQKLLACPVGVFGQRLISIARTYGCDVEVLDTPLGYGVDAGALAGRLRADINHEIAGILLTHNETSTGVQNDMAALSGAIGDHPALVVVDSVSGLGASKFTMDAWKFDIVVTASQKALGVPPGLAMAAVSARAWNTMERSTSPRFYFDLRKARDFATKGQTPWTPPISLMFALDVALDLYNREGSERIYARHAGYADALRAAGTAMGLPVFSHAPHHSVTVAALEIPEGLDAVRIVRTLHETKGIVISNGQQELRGKIVRIGTMGDITQTNILSVVGALEMALLDQGHRLDLGNGGKAAIGVLVRSDAESVAGAYQPAF